MSKKQAIELAACPNCGRDGQMKDAYQPFAHGWVGCRECQRFIKWSGKGKRTAIEAWNMAARREADGKS